MSAHSEGTLRSEAEDKASLWRNNSSQLLTPLTFSSQASHLAGEEASGKLICWLIADGQDLVEGEVKILTAVRRSTEEREAASTGPSPAGSRRQRPVS